MISIKSDLHYNISTFDEGHFIHICFWQQEKVAYIYIYIDILLALTFLFNFLSGISYALLTYVVLCVSMYC